VHVITGFLGSGKTTLLNKLLKQEAFANSAIIINEFGEVGLDHHLIEVSDDTIIELSNGCLCCTVRGQLIEAIEAILERNPERIIIETTGLADPVPVLQALIATPSLIDKIELGGLLTLYDAANSAKMIEQHEEASQQVRLADYVILTKLEHMPEGETLETVSADIRALNPFCQIINSEDFLATSKTIFSHKGSRFSPQPEAHSHAHHHDVNRHSERLHSTLLQYDKPIERQKIDMFLDLLLSAHGDSVLRIKGLVSISQDPRPLVIQGVGRTLSEPYFLDAWPSENHHTQLVVFLDTLKADFVQRLFSGFIGQPLIDTPDRDALAQNPLAVAGFDGKL